MLHARLRAAAGHAGDPLAGFVTSLLRFGGADGSTTFTDEAGNAWTGTGNAQIDTSWSQFGTGSLLLDGAGDAIEGPLSIVDWTQPLTLELFARPSSMTANGTLFGTRIDPGVIYGMALRLQTDGKIRFFGWDAGNALCIDITGGTSLTVSVATHVALDRDAGGTWRLYVDGGLDATGTETNPIADLSGEGFNVGTVNNNNNYYAGQIDAFRATVGASRYASGCTVPTSPYPAI